MKNIKIFILFTLLFPFFGDALRAQTCSPSPYAAEQTWWIPNRTSKVRIDFQTGTAVLNNPATGFLGQGVAGGFEGNVAVTHPLTGQLLFVTDGNVIYNGSTGVAASGPVVGGNGSSGESSAVIPDPQGVWGRDFIVFGNSAANIAGTLTSAKYNLETNTISNVSTLLPASSIYEALEVVPHANGTDYWILVNTVDQKVKSYLYSKASGFNPTAVSTIDVANLAGLDPSFIATSSFISWDPRTPGKMLISRHNKVGLANFNATTGILGAWQVYITTPANTTPQTGYGPAYSPNGRYIYYQEYFPPPTNQSVLKYFDLTNFTTTTLDVTPGAAYGLKIAPDGRLYGVCFNASFTYQLYYLNANANTPPAVPGSLLQFNTGGRQTSLQLPNNVYWACIPCQAGTVAPALANTTITTGPATVGNLIALLSASNQPAGTVITIHAGATATTANKLANGTAIVNGTTYYVSFYDGLNLCYSPTTPVLVFRMVPFTCDSKLYVSKEVAAGVTTGLTEMATGTALTFAPAIGTAYNPQYNALGYNPVNNLMYGIIAGTRQLVMIGANGTYRNLGNVASLPTPTGASNSFNAGEFDASGNFYVKQNGLNSSIYKVNVLNLTASTINLVNASAVAVNLNLQDMAFNINDNKLYSTNSADGNLVSIDLAAAALGTTTVIGGGLGNASISYDAMFGSPTGIYGLGNNGAGLTKFDLITGKRATLYTSATFNGLDGAHCSTAPIVTPFCIQFGDATSPGIPTQTGISSLVGFANGWPGNVPNGFIAIESKNKGFVITRVSSVSAIPVADLVEGMLVYDNDAACVKLYNGSVWKCLQRSCNQ